MRRSIKIVLSLFILFTILIIVIVYQKINKIGIDITQNNSSVEDVSKRPDWMKTLNSSNHGSIFYNLFQFESAWNDEKYPISKHFKEKFKTKKDVNDNFDIKEPVDANIESGEKQIVSLFYDTTKYYYKYYINDLGELDDLEYIREVEYKKDEYWGNSFLRLDGKIEADNSFVYNLLAYIANKYVNDDFAWNPYEELAFSEEKMPYADNCKIINRPNLEELGIPNASYWYDSDLNENYDGTGAYSKDGYPYLIFEYDDHNIKYEVKYHVNDENFFDYIEFVEVKD